MSIIYTDLAFSVDFNEVWMWCHANDATPFEVMKLWTIYIDNYSVTIVLESW